MRDLWKVLDRMEEPRTPQPAPELGAGIRGPSTDPEQQMGGSRDLAVVQPLEAFS